MIGMPIEAGTTAVIVAVPEAQDLVDRGRLLFDSHALNGVPAHVTILYPFVAEPDLTDDVVAAAQDILAERPAFDLEFATTARFDGDLVYLEPRPAQPFRDLTAAFAARWPDHPPYRGAYQTVIPHLTLLEPVAPDIADRFEADARKELPIRARVVQAELIGYDGERWRTLVDLRLA